MRTKALLLAAAFAATGVATSMAQVYSVNAVGYVNVNLNPGFNLVANPLDAGPTGNRVDNLFKNIQGTIPGGLKVFTFNTTTGGFNQAASWSDLDNVFEPPTSAAIVVEPGTGAFVYNPKAAGTAPLVLTFVGEVKQGTNMQNPLPKGFSIKSNIVPQAGKPDSFPNSTFPAEGGDKIFKFNKATGGYDTYTYDDLDSVWTRNGVVGLPVIEVGEAFFMYRAKSAGTWTRTFNVNNPA
jgi:hypothetical protein